MRRGDSTIFANHQTDAVLNTLGEEQTAAWARFYAIEVDSRPGELEYDRALAAAKKLSRDSQLGQRKLGALEIEGVNGLMDWGIECIGVGEGLMGEMMRLEVAPDGFDVV